MVRILIGAGLIVSSGVALKLTGQRVLRALAALFGATGVLAIGGYVLVSGVYRMVEARRRLRKSSR